MSFMTIDLTTNKTSKRSKDLLSIYSSAFFKPSHFKLNYGDYYEFDSLNYKYNFDNGFYVYKNIANCYNYVYTYLVDCVPFIAKNGKHYVESFKCMGEIEITAKSLYDFHCDYESIVKFALNKLSLRKEFFKYFNEFKFNLNYDFVVAFLCYFKNNNLLNVLMDYIGELEYPEMLLNICTRTIEQKDKKLNYINKYIDKYPDEQLIHDFLIKYDINPIPYIDKIVNEDLYLSLAQKYRVLRDSSKMISDKNKFLFAYQFGGVPNDISEEKYSFLTAKKISPNGYLRDNIISPIWAYKWASEIKTGIPQMRQILFDSIPNDVNNLLVHTYDIYASYLILFAALVDQITPSHPYYSQYLAVINNKGPHVKAMFLWLYYIDSAPIVNFFYMLDQLDVNENIYGNTNSSDYLLISSEEQGWIVLLDAFYGPIVSIAFNEEYSRDYDILKHVTNPYYITEQYRLNKNANPTSSLDTILEYDGITDISQWIYEYVKNQTNAISITADLSKFLTDPYWRMRTEFLIQKKITPGQAS